MALLEYVKDLSLEYVVMAIEMEIAGMASRVYFSPRSEWQTGVNNYASIVDALESMVWPYLKETKYPPKKKQLQKNARALIDKYQAERKENQAAYVKKGRNYEMNVFLTMIEIQWRFIQEELKKQGLLRQVRAHAVDERTAAGMAGGSGGAMDEGRTMEEILHDISGRTAP